MRLQVALEDVGVAGESKIDSVSAEETLEAACGSRRRGALEIAVRMLAALVGIERKVEEGELVLSGVGGEIVLEPEILSARGRPVVVVVVLVQRGGAHV